MPKWALIASIRSAFFVPVALIFAFLTHCFNRGTVNLESYNIANIEQMWVHIDKQNTCRNLNTVNSEMFAQHKLMALFASAIMQTFMTRNIFGTSPLTIEKILQPQIFMLQK